MTADLAMYVTEAPSWDGEDPREITPWSSHITKADPWFTTAPTPRSWLLRDARRNGGECLLPLGNVAQLIAEGGAGKTMVLAQLSIAVATGEQWLSTFSVARAGRVLLIAGEEDEEEVHRRMFNARRSMCAHSTVPAGSIVVLPLAGVPCPMLERDREGNAADAPFLVWLREWATKNGPWSLILVDPLSRFAGPDAELDNAAATRFVQALESVAKATGATVLVAHHTNKGSRKGGAVDAAAGRGASALVDGVRWHRHSVVSVSLSPTNTHVNAWGKSSFGRTPRATTRG